LFNCYYVQRKKVFVSSIIPSPLRERSRGSLKALMKRYKPSEETPPQSSPKRGGGIFKCHVHESMGDRVSLIPPTFRGRLGGGLEVPWA
jgi:hypothetical protein